jgi:hypothetical protein
VKRATKRAMGRTMQRAMEIAMGRVNLVSVTGITARIIKAITSGIEDPSLNPVDSFRLTESL